MDDAIPELVVLASMWKQAVQARKAAALHVLCTPASRFLSCLSPCLDFLRWWAPLWRCKPKKPFLHKLALFMGFCRSSRNLTTLDGPLGVSSSSWCRPGASAPRWQQRTPWSCFTPLLPYVLLITVHWPPLHIHRPPSAFSFPISFRLLDESPSPILLWFLPLWVHGDHLAASMSLGYMSY